MKTETKIITIEFGIMSNKHSVKCENCRKDSWINFSGDTEKRIEELFKEFGGLEKFITENKDEIKVCMKTIKRIV